MNMDSLKFALYFSLVILTPDNTEIPTYLCSEDVLFFC